MKLIDLYPYRLGEDPYIADFENAVQVSLDDLEAAYNQMIKNLFADTTVEWLSLWEKAYGLTGTGTIEARRGALKAKMRGVATTTEDLIRSVADAYSDEPAQLVVDNPNYSFYLYIFSDDGSAPENLDNLRRVIEEIKPAHLAFDIFLQMDAGEEALYTGSLVTVAKTYEF